MRSRQLPLVVIIVVVLAQGLLYSVGSKSAGEGEDDAGTIMACEDESKPNGFCSETGDVVDDSHPALDFDLTVNKIWRALKCTEMNNPIHTKEAWTKFRDTYHQILERFDRQDVKKKLHPSQEGFQFPVEIGYLPRKGRAVFVKEGTTIPKGSLVWTKYQTATFAAGAHYRHFLASLPVPFACDVLQWAYVQDFDGNGHYQIAVDLDEGSFMNSGGKKSKANVDCGGDRCNGNLYAKRNLKGGEEILCSYSDFASSKGWKDFGL